jgi:hypothetical protein
MIPENGRRVLKQMQKTTVAFAGAIRRKSSVPPRRARGLKPRQPTWVFGWAAGNRLSQIGQYVNWLLKK